ncbi:mitochondrial iron ion transporter [Macrolepiota fuliginosa MF-IS2]|uniref:Mitochondrial iron ion transporter n=1 Tax=Macrolepiota fuliginosa MF-IS2 TaxID=1400762 RepID=A0A9P6C7I6_9AGAR|nr:mitochondrial iron ion transporter [Macrolepiota fuliginosa MF-IS2]
MAQRHTHTSQVTNRKINGTAQSHTQDHDDHDHDHDHSHSHSHSHSIFGHSHSHNGENGHSHDAEQIVAALRGDKRDRGSYITLVGLASNVLLTVTKGAAGWFLHSASLLADAGHSLSDLLGDFVVLFCWNLSRKPPSERYPYGFAKFETLGTTTISLLLIGGALGIGVHSYQLLLATLSETLPNIPPGVLHDAVENVTLIAPDLPVREHSHVHAVDVNAAWFAAIGVIVKEWLYWITKRVADQENSPVLLANAIHHRSDAYSSAVALFAILGTWYFPALPLDPIGGLLVSLVILRQGYSLLKGAWGDLTDAGVSRRKQESLQRTLTPLLKTGIYDDTRMLIGVENVRARRAGSMLFVDMTAKVDAKLSVTEIAELEHKITKTMQKAKKEVAEVRVRFEPVSSS